MIPVLSPIDPARCDSVARHTRAAIRNAGTAGRGLFIKGMQSRMAGFGLMLLMAAACSDDLAQPEDISHASTLDSAATASAVDVASASGDSLRASATKGERSGSSGVVRTDMRNVNMHVSPGIVLAIRRLRGTVLSTRKGSPPALNDKGSMLINIESGDIAIDTNSLANILNRHVFGYPKSPLKNLRVSIAGNEMIQTGKMKKVVWLSFRIRATMAVTPEHEIRVHPVAISVAGIGVKGLSRQLGGLSKLIKLEPGHGARLDGDDFILTPSEMLPPPAIRGQLTDIKLEPGGVRQIFGAGDAARTKPVTRSGSSATNFMYFHGGTLRFGKLTMSGTDLEIVDGDQSNPFEYSLDRYQDHLVAGHSNTTPVDGLIVVMPDLQKLITPATKR